MSYIANSVHGLTLGGLVLVENGADKLYTHGPSGETYTFGVLDADTSWGNLRPVTETLLSMLTNGSRVVHVRDENREPSISVTIEASGASALQAAEVVLNAVVGKPTELVWQPPAWASVPTVFDIVWSELQHQMDSFGERYMRRSYSIKLQALPYARSATKVITPAIVTAAPTVVDPGTSATNWTAPRPTGAAVTVVSGAVRSTYDPDVLGSSYYGTDLRRTFPIALDVSVNKFVAVDWKTSLAVVHGLVAVNGVPFADLTEVRREPAPTAGFTRSWYRFSDATTSVTQFNFSVIHPANAAATATLDIDQVLSANALPASGTTRQKVTSLYPGGSVPAEGTIAVEHPSAGLGQVIVYSYPSGGGYSPPLRQWKIAGPAATVAASNVSGFENSLTSTSTIFDVPVASFPNGAATLWAFLRRTTGTGTVRINMAVLSTMGAVDVSSIAGDPLPYIDINFPDNAWRLVPLLRTTLPPVQMGVSGRIQVHLNEPTGSNIVLDEAYIFGMDIGRLTIVDCGTGTPAPGGVARRLTIEAPSADRTNGGVFLSTDQVDGYVPQFSKVACDQTGHKFDPNGANIFTVTSGVTDAAVSMEHYRRWHTHAGS